MGHRDAYVFERALQLRHQNRGAINYEQIIVDVNHNRELLIRQLISRNGHIIRIRLGRLGNRNRSVERKCVRIPRRDVDGAGRYTADVSKIDVGCWRLDINVCQRIKSVIPDHNNARCIRTGLRLNEQIGWVKCK